MTVTHANHQVLDAVRKLLLEAFDGTYEGPLEHYLGCEIACDVVAGTTQLSQMHYAKEVLHTFGFSDTTYHTNETKHKIVCKAAKKLIVTNPQNLIFTSVIIELWEVWAIVSQ